jgi:hypothetical protein
MATETQVRRSIRCCLCGQIFTLLIDTAGEPEISLTCLYCGKPLHINLAKYPTTETEVMRIAGDHSPRRMTVYLLPEVLETETPETR